MKKAPYILTIAGFDPSNGAGLTADVKTFEAHKINGLAVCTAITVQNDLDFKSCNWVALQTITNQIETLFERFTITVVKIGIIESWEVLLTIQEHLKKLNPDIKIILDPVLKASSGFNFHNQQNIQVFEKVLKNCFFITPNYDEIKGLFPDKTIDDTIDFIAERTNIYLKGGHRIEKKGWDEVYYNKLVQLNLPPISKNIFQKHGSGCVLSSTLAANIFKGLPIDEACKHTKAYIEQFLNSNNSLLGSHY